MLDSCQSDDYAAGVAQDVARRYGLSVSPAVVQRVPVGLSGLSQPVWDEKTARLIYVEAVGKRGLPGWNKRPSSDRPARQGLVNPVVAERRLKVADLHATGANDFEIAEQLGQDVRVIRVDRRVLKLPANYIRERGPKTVTEIRIKRIGDLVAQGKTKAEMIADMGISDRTLRSLAQRGNIVLPLTVRVLESRADRRSADLQRLMAEGLSREAICARLGVVDRTLRVIAARAGVILPPKTGGRARRSGPAAPKARLYGNTVLSYPSAKERRAVLAGLDLTSMTVADLVAHFGGAVPQPRIREDLRGMGVRPAGVKVPVVQQREARLAKIRALDVATMTVADLAARFDVTSAAIRADLRELALTPAPDEPWKAHNAEVQARIAALVAKGFSRAQIIAAEPMSPQTLWRHLRAAGLSVPRADGSRKARKTHSSPEEMDKLREDIRRLRLQGLTLDQISAAVDRSSGTVSYHVSKLGLAGEPKTLGGADGQA